MLRLGAARGLFDEPSQQFGGNYSSTFYYIMNSYSVLKEMFIVNCL